MQPEKKDIRALSEEAIKEWLTSKGIEPYRGQQIYHWLWKRGVHNFEEMSNIPVTLKKILNNQFSIYPIQLNEKQESKDGTVKFSFRLFDGHLIESVLIPSGNDNEVNRVTACVSTQVGCSLNCLFCATGKLKKKRNLSVGEIYDQVAVLKRESKTRFNLVLTNIVFMGMGEPLLNYKNLLEGINRINAETGLGISARRITVSTAGVTKMIKKLADDDIKFNLSISLHAANDDKRSKIMPINNQNSISRLKEALQYFSSKVNTKLTYEYILFKNFNDDIKDADELRKFCNEIPGKVNIIGYNPIRGTKFKMADKEKTTAFIDYLKNKHIIVNYRESRGSDINAACGQLADKRSKS